MAGGFEVPEDAPDEVKQRSRRPPRAPQTDPTLGIVVDPRPDGAPPRHPLVVIGDSLTHGFQSGAIYNTDLSYGAIVAYELGRLDRFQFPRYPGRGGLPLNIEFLLRDLEERYGNEIEWLEFATAPFHIRNLMNDIEEYWERGPGAVVPNIATFNHALAVFGWDLRDALDKTFTKCEGSANAATNNFLIPMVDNAADRAAMRVYPSGTGEAKGKTLFDVAREMGEPAGPAADDPKDIETLVVFLGANNALGSVVKLRLKWSEDPGYQDPSVKSEYTVWQPAHFRSEYDLIVAELDRIDARNVILCTVPHVTIPPVARGIGGKVGVGSRYFKYYTRPWIEEEDFDPNHDENLTAEQARAVDYAIDMYNEYIQGVVADKRGAGKNWFLFDVAGILDRLAFRRYIDDPSAQPIWWTPYPLPRELTDLQPTPDTRFLTADGKGGRATGGLFSLDGIHPTTVGYGIIAQELIRIMERVGVQFNSPNGTPRVGRISVDFDRLIRRDTLINTPPQNINDSLGIIGWLDQTVDVFTQVIRGGAL